MCLRILKHGYPVGNKRIVGLFCYIYRCIPINNLLRLSSTSNDDNNNNNNNDKNNEFAVAFPRGGSSSTVSRSNQLEFRGVDFGI